MTQLVCVRLVKRCLEYAQQAVKHVSCVVEEAIQSIKIEAILTKLYSCRSSFSLKRGYGRAAEAESCGFRRREARRKRLGMLIDEQEGWFSLRFSVRLHRKQTSSIFSQRRSTPIAWL